MWINGIWVCWWRFECQFPDNRWYCEMDRIARLYDMTPPFWKIKHVLKYQLCNCGLRSYRWAPSAVVNAPFECSSTRRMVWKGCWKCTPPPLPHGNKCIRIICRSVFHHDNTNIVVRVMAGGTSTCQTFHQLLSIRIQQSQWKNQSTALLHISLGLDVRVRG